MLDSGLKCNVCGRKRLKQSHATPTNIQSPKIWGIAKDNAKCTNSILNICAVIILVRFEITSALEAKSLTKLTSNKNTTNGDMVVISAALSCVLEKSTKTRGVSTKIAPSFAKIILTTLPKTISKTKSRIFRFRLPER